MSSTSPLLHSDDPDTGPREPLIRIERPSLLATAPLVLLALMLAGGVVVVIDRVAPSLPLAVVGGVGLVGLVTLAAGRYEAAVALGFLLSGVVKIEPAPPDGVFAVIIAVAIVTGRLRIDRVPAPILAVLGGLVAINVLSFAAAFSIGDGLRFSAITFYVIVFSIWLAGYADRDRRGRHMVIAWLCIAVFSAVLGTLALQLPSFPMRLEFIADGASRASALFKDPNVYGPFLVPITVILLEEMIAPRLLRIRALTGFALLGVLIVGLIFSFSRAAWANMLLSTAIMLAIVLLRRRHTVRLFAIIGGLGIVGMIVLAVVVFSGQATFIGQRAQLQGYDTERFSAQRAGIELAGHYPLGVGPGQFQFHHPIETHSTYVRVLAEQGPFGLMLWVTLCLLTLGLAISNAFAGRSSAGIGSAALLGSWCGLLFNSVVVDTLHWRHLWVVAGLIWAGAMINQVNGRRDDDAERLSGPDRSRSAFGMGAVGGSGLRGAPRPGGGLGSGVAAENAAAGRRTTAVDPYGVGFNPDRSAPIPRRPTTSAPAANPRGEETAPAAKPRPEASAPAAKPRREKTAPAAKPRPEASAPAAKPRREKTAPAAKPRPQDAGPSKPGADDPGEPPPGPGRGL